MQMPECLSQQCPPWDRHMYVDIFECLANVEANLKHLILINDKEAFSETQWGSEEDAGYLVGQANNHSQCEELGQEE